MNVPNIGQGPGGVATLPSDVAGSDVGARRPDARASGDRGGSAAADTIELRRLAWFDVNGDGSIDPRSALAGGDGTLLVPEHAVDLPTFARQAPNAHPGAQHAHVGPQPAHADDGAPPAAAVSNPAQTSKAIDAYQRYGNAPDATAAAPPSTPPSPSPAVAVA